MSGRHNGKNKNLSFLLGTTHSSPSSNSLTNAEVRFLKPHLTIQTMKLSFSMYFFSLTAYQIITGRPIVAWTTVYFAPRHLQAWTRSSATSKQNYPCKLSLQMHYSHARLCFTLRAIKTVTNGKSLHISVNYFCRQSFSVLQVFDCDKLALSYHTELSYSRL